MAFGDSAGRFWQVDLSTRLGALSAANTAGMVCFFQAARIGLGGLLMGGFQGFSSSQAISSTVGLAAEIALATIAGFRLRAGKGIVWGSLLAVMMAIEIPVNLLNFAIGSAFINGLLLVYLINGIRGAVALKRGLAFEDEDVEVFN